MPRSILLGRPWPQPGEPLFLPDDTDGALELQADEDIRCPRGHHLDETVGEVGPSIDVDSWVCEACAAEDGARHAASKDAEHAGGETAADLLHGRYFVARIGDTDD